MHTLHVKMKQKEFLSFLSKNAPKSYDTAEGHSQFKGKFRRFKVDNDMLGVRFRTENMLIDPRGRLRIIDNEWFAIDPAGLDLGRSFTRWPMSQGAWGRFRRAYRSMITIRTSTDPARVVVYQRRKDVPLPMPKTDG